MFFLCGLWHGAAFTFVVWGLYHGALLVLERLYRTHVGELPAGIAAWALTPVLVAVGWVLFRSPTLPYAFAYISALFGATGGSGVYPVSSFLSGEKIVALSVGIMFSLVPFEGRLYRLRGSSGFIAEGYVCTGDAGLCCRAFIGVQQLQSVHLFPILECTATSPRSTPPVGARLVRALFVAVFLAILVLPAVQAIKPIIKVVPVEDNRPPAPPPDFDDIVLTGNGRLAPAVNVWFDDHLSLRSLFIGLHNQLDYWLFRHSDKVYIGRDGMLFFAATSTNGRLTSRRATTFNRPFAPNS